MNGTHPDSDGTAKGIIKLLGSRSPKDRADKAMNGICSNFEPIQ